ncbi:hypothetical protein IAT38_003480 [Cryptococcus sp. DSM 104549]
MSGTAPPTTDKSTFKVIVVGGGLSGLATAHALERAKKEQGANVQVTVYEQRKEESEFSRYPVHLIPDGRSALQAILSKEEYTRLLALSPANFTHGGITIFTPGLSRLFGIKRYEGELPSWVGRGTLKEILREGVGMVRGKRAVRVRKLGEAEGEGRKEVVFDDGSKEVCDLVVGADGLGSTLRAQLSPNHTRFPLLPFIIIQLKLATPLAAIAPIADPAGINMLLGAHDTSLLLVPFAGRALPKMTKGAALKGQSPFDDPDDSVLAVQDALTKTGPDAPGYTFAILTVPAFAGWEDLMPGAWVRRVVDILQRDKTAPEVVRAFEDDVVPGTVGAWQVVSTEEGNAVPWGGGRVVLVGDAAHAMPPTAGGGGSSALKDGELLAKAILSSTELGGEAGPLDTLLPAFHAEMITRSHGLMNDARRRLYLSCKSGLRVYTRMILLKVMDWLWPLANWVLNRGREGAKKTNRA